MEASLLNEDEKQQDAEQLLREAAGAEDVANAPTFEERSIEEDEDDIDVFQPTHIRNQAPMGKSSSTARQKIRNIFDCGLWFLLTIFFLILILLIAIVSHPKTALLTFCALVPGLIMMAVMMITHNVTFTSTELQWEMFWSGAIAILVALFAEIALNGAIQGILRFLAPDQYQTIIQKKGGHKEVVQLMTHAMKFVYFFLNAFIVAGFTEEMVKFALVYRIQHKLKKPIACVIYGICGALGFATVENIKYVILAGIKAQYNPLIIKNHVHSYFAELLKNNPFLYGVIVAFERGFTSVPGHCLFGAIIGLGFARRLVNSDVRSEGIDKVGIRAIPWWLVLMPSLVIHGTYDLALMTSGMLAKGWVRSLIISLAHSMVFFLLIGVIIAFVIINQQFKKTTPKHHDQTIALLEDELQDELSDEYD